MYVGPRIQCGVTGMVVCRVTLKADAGVTLKARTNADIINHTAKVLSPQFSNKPKNLFLMFICQKKEHPPALLSKKQQKSVHPTSKSNKFITLKPTMNTL